MVQKINGDFEPSSQAGSKVSIAFHFGTKEKPIGLLNPEEWERTRPDWKQVHGISIAEVKGSHQACGQVDGLWTSSLDQPIAVVTADCVPILLYRRDEKAVAALHAGWRGVEQRILSHFFTTLPEALSNPKDWIAMLGPSIRSCCYEVSPELIEQFQTRFPDLPRQKIEPSHRKLDMIGILTHELEQLGTECKAIDLNCTYCAKSERSEPLYFSYRRGDRNSRQYSMIELKKT